MGDMPHGASRCDVPNAGGVSPISRLSESILLRPLDGYTAIRDHEDVATSKASEKTTLNAQETTSHTQELSQMAQETGVNAQDLSTRIIEALKKDPTLDARDLSTMLDTSHEAIRYRLRKLRGAMRLARTIYRNDALTAVDVTEYGTDVTNSGTDVTEKIALSHDGNGTESTILKILQSDPTMTASTLAEETGKSRRQVLMTLSSPQDSGRLERIGPARGSRSQSRRLAAEGVGACRNAPCYKAASEFARIRDYEDVATSKASEKTTPNAQETTSHTQELSQMAQETGVNAQDLSTRLFVERGEHSCSGIVGIRLDFTIHDVSCFVHGGFRLGIVAGLANVEGQAALHDRLVQENVYSFCERHAQACKD